MNKMLMVLMVLIIQRWAPWPDDAFGEAAEGRIWTTCSWCSWCSSSNG